MIFELTDQGLIVTIPYVWWITVGFFAFGSYGLVFVTGYTLGWIARIVHHERERAEVGENVQPQADSGDSEADDVGD